MALHVEGFEIVRGLEIGFGRESRIHSAVLVFLGKEGWASTEYTVCTSITKLRPQEVATARVCISHDK